MKDQQAEYEQAKPLQTARERRHLAAAIYQLKPLQLGIVGAALISLLAVLYLNVVGMATQANQRLQQLAADQAQLQTTNQNLRQKQGTLQSPGYIISHAKQMGMVPEDPSKVPTIIIPGPR